MGLYPPLWCAQTAICALGATDGDTLRTKKGFLAIPLERNTTPTKALQTEIKLLMKHLVLMFDMVELVVFFGITFRFAYLPKCHVGFG